MKNARNKGINHVGEIARPYKRNNGITLIALIVTIIILLILAGAVINMAIGADGIFSRASDAVNRHNEEVTKEQQTLQDLAVLTDNYNPQYIGGQYNEEKKVNTPQLDKGLIPVKINLDGTATEVVNPNTDSSWYNYTTEDKQWANAITKNSLGQITGYWVWIPRYAYQITSQYHTGGTGAGTINIKFLKNKTNEASDGTTTWDNATGINNWNIHPAFTDDVSTGGWDEEIAGFWVAKFPAGFAGRK